MHKSYGRSGFTLIETMVATTIVSLAFIAIAATFLFCQRMFSLTMAESETTLALREIRDKLLFRAGPGLKSGLLTGKASADSASIIVDWETTMTDGTIDELSPSKIRLVWRTDTGQNGNYFFNERISHTPYNINWFKPSGFKLQRSWVQTVDLPRIRIDMGDVGNGVTPTPIWLLLPQ